MKIALIYLISIGTLLSLVSCDSGDTSNIDTTLESEDKYQQNPNYDLYDENCHQDQNSSLCGFAGGGSSGVAPIIPEAISECQDQEYCL